jgi:hypothetical protein
MAESMFGRFQEGPVIGLKQQPLAHNGQLFLVVDRRPLDHAGAVDFGDGAAVFPGFGVVI